MTNEETAALVAWRLAGKPPVKFAVDAGPDDYVCGCHSCERRLTDVTHAMHQHDLNALVSWAQGAL